MRTRWDQTRLNTSLPETEVHRTNEVPASRELRVPSRPFPSPTSFGDLGQGVRAKPFLADMILPGP